MFDLGGALDLVDGTQFTATRVTTFAQDPGGQLLARLPQVIGTAAATMASALDPAGTIVGVIPGAGRITIGFGNTRCIKVVLDNSGPAPAVELQAGVTVTGVGRIVLERLRLSQAGVDVLSFTTDQHIHRPVPAGQVDQHRAVVAPPAQRELIHTEHRHHADGGSGSPRINPNSVDRLRHTQRRGKP